MNLVKLVEKIVELTFRFQHMRVGWIDCAVKFGIEPDEFG
jgi:hypothetical protein